MMCWHTSFRVFVSGSDVGRKRSHGNARKTSDREEQHLTQNSQNPQRMVCSACSAVSALIVGCVFFVVAFELVNTT